MWAAPLASSCPDKPIVSPTCSTFEHITDKQRVPTASRDVWVDVWYTAGGPERAGRAPLTAVAPSAGLGGGEQEATALDCLWSDCRSDLI